MAELYSIADWDRYENSRTRTMKEMRWVPVPNSHDGDGYCALMERKDGTEILGAWVLILQVASKCKERGVLRQKHGDPHTAATIARVTRGSEKSISRALDVLCRPDVGWVICAYQEPDTNVTPSYQGTDYGIERNGIERNRTEPAQAKRYAGPQDQLARDLAKALGSSLNQCRKQIRALREGGMELDDIRPHLRRAMPGMAPWDWTKKVTGQSGLSSDDFQVEAERLRREGR